MDNIFHSGFKLRARCIPDRLNFNSFCLFEKIRMYDWLHFEDFWRETFQPKKSYPQIIKNHRKNSIAHDNQDNAVYNSTSC
jgi:hypothetical protein